MEWTAQGRADGASRVVLTLIWTRNLDEPVALRWTAAIASGAVPEDEQLVTLGRSRRAPPLQAEIAWCKLPAAARAQGTPPRLRNTERHRPNWGVPLAVCAAEARGRSLV